MIRIKKNLTLLALFVLGTTFISAGAFPTLNDTVFTANITAVYFMESLILDVYLYVVGVFSILFYSNFQGLLVLLLVFTYFTESLKESLKGDKSIWIKWFWTDYWHNIFIKLLILILISWALLSPTKIKKVHFVISKPSGSTTYNPVEIEVNTPENQLQFGTLTEDFIGSTGSSMALPEPSNEYSSIAPFIMVAPIMLYQRFIYGIPQKEFSGKVLAETGSALGIPVLNTLLINNIVDLNATIQSFLYVFKAPQAFLKVAASFEGFIVPLAVHHRDTDKIYMNISRKVAEQKNEIKNLLKNHVNRYLKLISDNSPQMTKSSVGMGLFLLKHLGVSLGYKAGDNNILDMNISDYRKKINTNTPTPFGNYFPNIRCTSSNASECKMNNMNIMFKGTVQKEDDDDENNFSSGGQNIMDKAENKNVDINDIMSHLHLEFDPNAYNGFDLTVLLGEFKNIAANQWKLMAEELSSSFINALLLDKTYQPALSNGLKLHYPMQIKNDSSESLLLSLRQARSSGTFEEDHYYPAEDGDIIISNIKKYINNKLLIYFLQNSLDKYYEEAYSIATSDYAKYDENLGDGGIMNQSGLVKEAGNLNYDYDSSKNLFKANIAKNILLNMQNPKKQLSTLGVDSFAPRLKNTLGFIAKNSNQTMYLNEKKCIVDGTAADIGDKKALENDSNRTAFKVLGKMASYDNQALYNVVEAMFTGFYFDPDKLFVMEDGSTTIKQNWINIVDNLNIVLKSKKTEYQSPVGNGVKLKYNQIVKEDDSYFFTNNAKTAVLQNEKKLFKDAMTSVNTKIKNLIDNTSNNWDFSSLYNTNDNNLKLFWNNWLLKDTLLQKLIDTDITFFKAYNDKAIADNKIIFKVYSDYDTRVKIKKLIGGQTLTPALFLTEVKKAFRDGAKKAPHIWHWVDDTLFQLAKLIGQYLVYNHDTEYAGPVTNSSDVIAGSNAAAVMNDISDDIQKNGGTNVGDTGDSGHWWDAINPLHYVYMFGAWLLSFFLDLAYNIIYALSFVAILAFLIFVSVFYGIWLIWKYMEYGIKVISMLLQEFSRRETDVKKIVDTLWNDIAMLLRAQTGPLILAVYGIVMYMVGELLINLFIDIFTKSLIGSYELTVGTFFFLFTIMSLIISSIMLRIMASQFFVYVGMEKSIVGGVSKLAMGAAGAGTALAGKVTSDAKDVISKGVDKAKEAKMVEKGVDKAKQATAATANAVKQTPVYKKTATAANFAKEKSIDLGSKFENSGDFGKRIVTDGKKLAASSKKLAASSKKYGRDVINTGTIMKDEISKGVSETAAAAESGNIFETAYAAGATVVKPFGSVINKYLEKSKNIDINNENSTGGETNSENAEKAVIQGEANSENAEKAVTQGEANSENAEKAVTQGEASSDKPETSSTIKTDNLQVDLNNGNLVINDTETTQVDNDENANNSIGIGSDETDNGVDSESETKEKPEKGIFSKMGGLGLGAIGAMTNPLAAGSKLWERTQKDSESTAKKEDMQNLANVQKQAQKELLDQIKQDSSSISINKNDLNKMLSKMEGSDIEKYAKKHDTDLNDTIVALLKKEQANSVIQNVSIQVQQAGNQNTPLSSLMSKDGQNISGIDIKQLTLALNGGTASKNTDTEIEKIKKLSIKDLKSIITKLNDAQNDKTFLEIMDELS